MRGFFVYVVCRHLSTLLTLRRSRFASPLDQLNSDQDSSVRQH